MAIKGAIEGWDWDNEFALDILNAIQLLATTNLKRVDHDAFTAYWAGSVLRVDIKGVAVQ